MYFSSSALPTRCDASIRLCLSGLIGNAACVPGFNPNRSTNYLSRVLLGASPDSLVTYASGVGATLTHLLVRNCSVRGLAEGCNDGPMQGRRVRGQSTLVNSRNAGGATCQRRADTVEKLFLRHPSRILEAADAAARKRVGPRPRNARDSQLGWDGIAKTAQGAI